MQSTHLLPLLTGALWPKVVALDRVLFMGEIELTVYLCKTELFEIELFICIKMDLTLNNLQWLICHKIKPNQTQK